jgi:hypothetical protein
VGGPRPTRSSGRSCDDRLRAFTPR